MKKAYLQVDHENSNELSRVLLTGATDDKDTGSAFGLEDEILQAIKDDNITLLSAEYSPLRNEIVFRKAVVEEDEDAEPSGDTNDGPQPLIIVDWELI